MASHALATVTNPSVSLTDFTLLIDLATMPASWWSTVDTSDGTKGRVYKGDGETELASDWINFDDDAETGLLRVKWSDTLATSGTQQVWIEPPVSANASYAADDTYGSDNAYDGSWALYLPFEEASGIVYDRTGNSNDGTAAGTPGYGATGKVGAGIDFEHDDSDAFSVADSASMNVNGDITILAWVNPEAFTESLGHIVGGYSWGGGYAGYAFVIDNTGHITVWNGSGWQSAAGQITTGSLQHIGYTNDGATNRYYISGAEDSTDSAGNPNSYAGVRYIAADANGTQEYDGILDEVQIHSAARSAAWIASEYAQSNNNETFWGEWGWVPASGGTTLLPILLAMDHLSGGLMQ